MTLSYLKKMLKPRSFYTGDINEVKFFNKAYKVVESITNMKQYDATLKYVNLFYERTQNFSLYSTLLENLETKKTLID